MAEIAGFCDSASLFGYGFSVAHGYNGNVGLIDEKTSGERKKEATMLY
jgi:hypothetical protein